ncbi:hypothetical protein [Naasia sp. SYSU D00057]|uniref:hypothetical protein n=1 Tax=Naasia sp. SYSU D00057 TaxID=2817380 RepID=UPI001B318012|nr:hypothetical protein [Naasia sp. SYSU D00057]
MSTSGTGRDDAVGEPFDQTNGLAGDQLGESDGTAEGELSNAAERDAGDDDQLPPASPARGGAQGI